ncbi:MAG: hypothetical protein OEZ06_31315 [Myxococcales bacterium]|nr:hypothetical protein [Myxococcales bacterium]
MAISESDGSGEDSAFERLLQEAAASFEASLAAARLGPEVVTEPCATARLGDLVGGERGGQMRKEAEASLRALGCRSPGWTELYFARAENA